MFIVHVHIHVKPEMQNAFIQATRENAIKSTTTETGVVRFDIIQEIDDPTRFVLLEVYRSKDDAARHKETNHYNLWRQIAEPMMIEPRTRVFYSNIFPQDQDY